MNTERPVVTRFAPSPTGFLHIGGVRTALFAYLFAKQHNGTFILRIEDTDKNREVAGSIEQIQRSLRWLGLEWDYGPDRPGPFGSCLQSDRLAIYRRYAQQLVDQGLAYPDPYTTEELESFRLAAEREKRPFLFRDHRPDTFETWDGSKPLRFKVSEIKRYTWHDAVRGELTAGEEMLDDFILIKADGYPTYNFAHIVDDLEMGVTHVMRGQEFIASTPKFLSLYDALEIEYPVFVTLPPIMGPDGKKKLSKRDGSKDMLEYQHEGYLPAAMMNFLALIGWNPGTEQEIFTHDELTQAFALEKIQKHGGAFNEDKLRWINKQYLGQLPHEDKLQYIQEALHDIQPEEPLPYERLKKLVPVIFERIHNKTEIREAYEMGEYDWWLKPSIAVDPAMVKWKNDASAHDVIPRLEHIIELLNNADFSSSETIKQAIWEYAETAGKGEVLWPLRVALTGRERSPDPFTCLFVLDKDIATQRIEEVIASIRSSD